MKFKMAAVKLLMFVQKSKMAAAAILNYNFVKLDQPTKSICAPEIPL